MTSISTFAANGDKFTEGNWSYEVIYGTNVSIKPIDKTQVTGDVTIPESFEINGTTYSVTSIGNDAFQNCSGLKSVTIPDSVTSIGWGAFNECSKLTSVKIGEKVETIGNFAFYRCSDLTSVTIGNSVDSIGEGAFQDCTSLTTVTIPDSVTFIGERAFSDCSGLESVTIGEKVETIGKYAFSHCSGLTSVTIPDSVTEISVFAFSGCSGLESVTIGDKVTSIGVFAFKDCSSLKSVTIGNSVTSIGDEAFNNCNALTSVTIPDSVTEIGNYAFSGCDGLKTVFYKKGLYVSNAKIPETATQIVYEISNENTTPIEIKPTSVIWGKGVKNLTVCSHLVGPHYKLVARNALTALFKGMKGLTITDTCEVCADVTPSAPTILQAEIKKMLGQNLKLIVEDPNKVLPEGAQLVAEWVKPGTARHKELSEMRDPTHEAENIAFLEITLLDKNGNALSMPLKDKVHVLLQLPTGYDKNDMQVALVKSDTDVEFSETVETKDGVDYIGYWSDHFSPYAFIDTLSAEEKIALNNNSNSSTTSGTVSAKTTPKTGDNYIDLYIALGSLMAAAVALMGLKRKKHCMK